MSLAASQLSHVYPTGTRINERGHVEVGGCDVVELARRHRDYDVLYASKAFPCTAVYRVLAEEGLACDVASGGELALALRGGFEPSRIYLHGNAKSERELHEAL